jgi:Domain of unknown function (DUF4326)
MTTELINLRTKDENGQKGYLYYKQKYGDRFEYIGCAINIFNTHIPGSIWCNQYHGQLEKLGRQKVVQLYKEYLLNNPSLLAKIPTLQDKVLACWCAPELCHGNVLMELLKY